MHRQKHHIHSMLSNEDLGISQNPFTWTFISDKQKGQLPAFDEVLPDVAHRFCARHLHNNNNNNNYSVNSHKVESGEGNTYADLTLTPIG